jgi:hypothetical protein
MRIPTLVSTAVVLWLGVTSVAAAHKLPAPENGDAGRLLHAGCTDTTSVRQLSEDLNRYNQSRVGVSDVLRTLADDYHLEGPVRERMLGFADSFADLGQHLPPPDPYSSDFHNFDFKVGLAFTALTVFLHTNNDELARHFYADRDNPDSELAHYLKDLDQIRETYMANLATMTAAREKCS